jgi:hypothetical protein
MCPLLNQVVAARVARSGSNVRKRIGLCRLLGSCILGLRKRSAPGGRGRPFGAWHERQDMSIRVGDGARMWCRGACAVLVCASLAPAQWSFVDLHPASATSHSVAGGAGPGQQVGWSGINNAWRASLWTGSAGSFVDLTPTGYAAGFAHATDGAVQVGRVSLDHFNYRAGMWSGSAASFVDLHPAGATVSWATGLGGGRQGGFATIGGAQRAALWSGSAASHVDLHPPGASASRITGFWGSGGGQQAGAVFIGGTQRASVWGGTAASYVDIHPAGAFESQARGAHGSTQVGYVTVMNQHAALWSGTAASFVDLNPAGATTSEAWGVYNNMQVGWAGLGAPYSQVAALWMGTSASFVNLHAALSPIYISSVALQVWEAMNGDIYVAGEAWVDNPLESHAVLWYKPIPAPGTVAVLVMWTMVSARRRREAAPSTLG